MKVPITRHEDASTLGGPASSRISTPTRRRARWGPRSWRPADRGSARSRLPAPKSEAIDVNACVAPLEGRLERGNGRETCAAIAGAAEAFTWSADYGGAEHVSRRR